MAPDFVRSWMGFHRQNFGDRPIRELCFPSSHNAGTYRRRFGTAFGTENNTLCQTRFIFDQLELGVRLFDIRPYLGGKGNSEWNCGHYTWTGKLGLQGASCAPIREVVEHVNRFTKDNAELVILNVSHIDRLSLEDPVHSKTEAPSSDEWQSLFSLLSQIENLFTRERAGENKDRPLQDLNLNEFIKDRAAVIVIVDTDQYRDEIYKHGLWPKTRDGGGDRLVLGGTSVLHMQTEYEAVGSTALTYLQDLAHDPARIIGKLSGNESFGLAPPAPHVKWGSVLNLAILEQEKEFPWLLQKRAYEGLPSSIEMDRIENVDLYNFCLATIYQQYNNIRAISNKVIVYSGKLITNPDTHNGIQEAIDSGKSFRVTNESMGGDPWYGMKKSCAVFYKQNGLLKGRWAPEGSLLHFELDILSVKYGPKQINDQRIYLSLLRSISERKGFHVSNETLGGDPQPGTVKDFFLRWRDLDSTSTREIKTNEYDYVDFETSWEKLARSSILGRFV